MRENSTPYRQAADAAWREIQNRLEAIKKKLGDPRVELVEVSYDGDSFLSLVDELPDEPKSPDPGGVEIRVAIEAHYRIVRQP